MQTSNELQNRVARLDRRTYAILIGLTVGLLGGGIGLLVAVAEPFFAIAAVLGVLAAMYILTDVKIALYGVIVTMLLLPFGTFPVKIGITPTLLDIVLAAFLLVYLMQWMTGKRQNIRLTPVHALVALYVMWLLLAFALGLRHAMPTSANIRQFAETLLSISLVFILVDLLRDPETLRRLVLVIMLAVGLQAFIALGLYILPDTLAESILVRLARIGYPNGGVIRYIESNPALGERAIGTWVDPNALGGVLTVSAAMIAPQLLTKKPVLRYRWLSFILLGAVGLALLLTSSRASFLAFGVGLTVIAVVHYRKLIPILIIGGLLFLLLPQTQGYVDRLIQAFMGADLATQMRYGEWTDALTLIGRYPITGVGFTGTPEIDIYTDVANMYLIMANQIGLAGLSIFLVTMLGVFAYGWRAWRIARRIPELEAIHLGYHVALLTALTNAVADLYFFRLDFQSSITWFWLLAALALAASRLALETENLHSTGSPVESTVAKPG